ncbi:hypothetical protein FSP39_009433 [Pinctada imbricata]|uniref:RRM domain-containing protein n=1 Tax=Pinctada imbricata TaxID=66713 RepID=A0AA89BQW8_PINIB|nr:hypothetical protein FSP39_009433 [Pinctada imbricata]
MEDKRRRNYKLLVDPMLRGGSTKIYRFEGVDPTDNRPVHVRDPRSRLQRLWTQRLAADLPVPRFKYDHYYVGAPPPNEVTFTNLNDNINKDFLENMVKQFGQLEEVKIYYNPKNKKHMGIGKVIFMSSKSAKVCADKLNQTSKMGNIMNVYVDAGGKERQRILEDLLSDQPKPVIPPPAPVVPPNTDPRRNRRLSSGPASFSDTSFEYDSQDQDAVKPSLDNFLFQNSENTYNHSDITSGYNSATPSSTISHGSFPPNQDPSKMQFDMMNSGLPPGMQQGPPPNTFNAQNQFGPGGPGKGNMMNQGPHTPGPLMNNFNNQGPPTPGFVNQDPRTQGFNNQGPQAPGFGNQGPPTPGFGNQGPQTPGFGNQGPPTPGFGNQGPQTPGFGPGQGSHNNFGNNRPGNDSGFGFQEPPFNDMSKPPPLLGHDNQKNDHSRFHNDRNNRNSRDDRNHGNRDRNYDRGGRDRDFDRGRGNRDWRRDRNDRNYNRDRRDRNDRDNRGDYGYRNDRDKDSYSYRDRNRYGNRRDRNDRDFRDRNDRNRDFDRGNRENYDNRDRDFNSRRHGNNRDRFRNDSIEQNHTPSFEQPIAPIEHPPVMIPYYATACCAAPHYSSHNASARDSSTSST